jgi:hypothetical protein
MEDISPLFAIEAEELLNEGKPEEAIELCYNGLAVYPDYPSAFIILASALQSLGETTRAIEEIEKALILFPNTIALIELKNELELSIIDSEPNTTNDGQIVLTQEVILTESENLSPIEASDDIDNQAAQPFEPEIEDTTINSDYKFINTEPLRLKFLRPLINQNFNNKNIQEIRANNLALIPGIDYSPLKIRHSTKLQNYNIQILPEEPASTYSKKIKEKKDYINDSSKVNIIFPGVEEIQKEFADEFNEDMQEPSKSGTNKTSRKKAKEKHFITETIANIYVQQKAYSQAIEAFKQLAEQFQEKKVYYTERINEISNFK